MEFFIGNKLYNYSEEQLNVQFLNHGYEADVYRIGNQAVKIYKPYCPKRRLDEQTVEEFKQYETERFLLPRETVYNEKHDFNGYVTKLIDIGSKDNIRRMKMHLFLDEIKLLTNDTKLLTKRGVTIYDLRLTDVLYGDGLYYCDPGSFIKETNMTEKEIEEDNKTQLHDLIIEEILGPCCKLTKKQKKRLKEMTLGGDYLSDIISHDDIKDKESTSQFVNRITK